MQINYTLQSNAFYKKGNEAGLNGTQKALYHEILDIANDAAHGEKNHEWKEYLGISTRQLVNQLKFGHTTIENARKVLVEKSFLQIRAGERKYMDCTEYHIVKLYDDKPATQADNEKQAAEDAEAQKYIAKLDNAARAYFEKLQDATDLSDLQTAQYLAVLGTDKCKNILKWVLKKGDAVGNVGNYFKWKANEAIKKAQHTQALLASIPQQQQEQDSWLD